MKSCPFVQSRTSRAVGSLGLGLVAALVAVPSAFASSHREAPYIAGSPKLDATDLYMFRSYEAGRQNFVTILANYMPFQDPLINSGVITGVNPAALNVRETFTLAGRRPGPDRWRAQDGGQLRRHLPVPDHPLAGQAEPARCRRHGLPVRPA